MGRRLGDKLSILFVSAASNVHTVRWVNSLAQEGHSVHLVYLPNHKPAQHKIDDRIALHPLRVRGGPGYYLNARSLRKIYERINPDIVNVHYATGYGTLSRIAGLSSVVLSVWGSDIYDFPHKSFLHRLILKRNLLHADAITSSSHCMANEIKRLFPKISQFNPFVIPFGIDVERFNPGKYKRAKRQKSLITIGTIKTLRRNYNIDIAIKAVAILAKDKAVTDNFDLKYEVYGDGPLRDELQTLIELNRLDKIVELRGSIPNTMVPKALSTMDIFCVTSAHESFGVAVIEAMAMKLPVVATDVDGFREVLSGNGLLVPVGNAQETAQALKKLILSKLSRQKMGKMGCEHVSATYDWQDNVQDMVILYRSIANKKQDER